jgi:exodeoxyribonuclease VII small subunit
MKKAWRKEWGGFYMQGKIVEKRELLAMLTEIYDQLEELESVLESNLSGLRQNWYEDQTDKITVCGNKLETIENELTAFSETKSETDNAKGSKSMQLELGF